jgi:hypothetical protein
VVVPVAIPTALQLSLAVKAALALKHPSLLAELPDQVAAEAAEAAPTTAAPQAVPEPQEETTAVAAAEAA